MSGGTNVPPLWRPAYFDGEILRASQLTAGQDFHRELRWLHNRSLHNWGIALGLGVTGAKGAMEVHVDPGYALDSLGRELILDAGTDVSIPATAGAPDGTPTIYFLTASYADDAHAVEVQAGACGASGAVRRREAPVLRWQDPHNSDPAALYRRGLDVVLAAIAVRNCKLARDVSLAERRNALAAPQPYVAAGLTAAEQTTWAPWPDKNPIGLATRVNTATAGFRSTPRYQAQIVGTRFHGGTIGGVTGLVLDGTAQITEADAAGFTVQIVLASGVTLGLLNPVPLNPPWVLTNAALRAELLGKLKWQVSWLGVEG
jgi:hypothetical protein